MRIAFFVNKFPTLSETFILDQITGLIDRGHEVDIHAEALGDVEQAHPEVAAYSLLRRAHFRPPVPRAIWRRLVTGAALAAWRLPRAPRVVGRCLNVLRFGRSAVSTAMIGRAAPLIDLGCPTYDVIHAHFAHNGLKAVQLRRAGAIGGPVLTTFHGFDVNVGGRKALRDRYRPLFDSGERFTANTRFTAQRAAELGCDIGRIDIHPVGIRTDQYHWHPRRLDPAPNEPLRVLTVARLTEKKGVEYGIGAIAKLKARYPRLRYEVAGDGPLRPALETLIDELDVRDHVRLLGPLTRDHVTRLYDTAHLFMLPSVTAANGDMEGQGLVIQEAQASGLPVVTTRHNGIPEGVSEGESALLVPERDSEALAAALAELIEHPERWPAMGRAGRKLVEERFDQEKLNDRLVEIYQQIAAQANGAT